MIQKLIEIPLEEIQVGKALTSDISTSLCCCICGKALKPNKEYKMVHLLTNGNIISSNEDFDNSQGFFPVGTECVKRLVINFSF